MSECQTRGNKNDQIEPQFLNQGRIAVDAIDPDGVEHRFDPGDAARQKVGNARRRVAQIDQKVAENCFGSVNSFLDQIFFGNTFPLFEKFDQKLTSSTRHPTNVGSEI